jgi:hypothetical protein
MRRGVVPLLVAGLLAACSADPAPPGGLTADDERQLNEAAEMLDANAVALNATVAEPETAEPDRD